MYPDRLIVMRHSERVDDLFPGWIEKTKSSYRPFDGNMPLHLPIDRPVKDFDQDTPITVCGQVLAGLVGRALGSQGYIPDAIYCSPAIRCIQTARAVKEACGSKALLRIEPGLFENAWLYPNATPRFATKNQLDGYPIDWSYRSDYTTADIFASSENISEYNDRIYITLRKLSLLSELVTDGDGLNILAVAHASTVDLAVGLFRSVRRNSTKQDLYKIGRRVPYCSTVVLEKRDELRGWTSNLYAIPNISYGHFSNIYQHNFVNRL